jgi:hypothetical protein
MIVQEGTPRKHKAARAELLACAWLLQQGYEVFRNVSLSGFIDIIAYKNGETLKLDVKSIHPTMKLPPILSDDQMLNNIMIIGVFNDGHCEIISPRWKQGSINNKSAALLQGYGQA